MELGLDKAVFCQWLNSMLVLMLLEVAHFCIAVAETVVAAWAAAVEAYGAVEMAAVADSLLDIYSAFRPVRLCHSEMEAPAAVTASAAAVLTESDFGFGFDFDFVAMDKHLMVLYSLVAYLCIQV